MLNRSMSRHCVVAAAAAATMAANFSLAGNTAQTGSPQPGNSNGNNYATISLSGSTAMKGFTVSPGIVFLPDGQVMFLSSGTFAPSGSAYKLSPTNAGSLNTSGSAPDAQAIRLEWHEQGSVEGILELVNDQIAVLSPTPTALVNRSPTIGNPTWISGNSFSSSGSNNGWVIDNFNQSSPNAQQQSRVQLAISDVKPIQGFSYNSNIVGAPAVVPGAKSWEFKPGQAGYGKGNVNAVSGGAGNIAGVGVAKSRQQLQDQSVLNIADAGNPTAAWNTGGVTNLQTNTVAITATTIAANPGTGLTQVNKTDAQWLQLTGRLKNGADFNVAARDVNSGTRNVAALNTGIDGSWAVGENDNGNGLVSNPADADSQYQIGHDASGNPLIRYSGKTAGGGQLRPTIQNSRLGVGTLSLPDAIGSGSGASTATPLRILKYNAGTDETASNFISPNATTITDGTYAIWQQEQYVTVKKTSAAFAGLNAAQWAATTDLQTGIKGDTANASTAQTGTLASGSNDITNPGSKAGFVVGQAVTGTGIPAGTVINSITRDPSNGQVTKITLSNAATSGGSVSNLVFSGGDVANFRANVLNAPANILNFTTVANPADQLVQQGFVLPQFMQVTKEYDGGPTSANAAFDINSNPNGYSDSLRTQYVNAENARGTGSHVNAADPSTITNGSSAYYGEGTRGHSAGVPDATPVALAQGNIAITSSNYLFGNFKNTGIRDYSSFKNAVAALQALEANGAGTDANTGGSNNTLITDAQLNAAQPGLAGVLGSSSSFVGQRGASAGGVTAPNSFGTGVTKGDLIVMGDYDGRGVFDGRSLYLMARGTALSDNTSTDTLASMDAVRTGVLRKNAAMDYLHGVWNNGVFTAGHATLQMEVEASIDGGNGFDKFDVLRNGNATGANARLNAKAINDTVGKDFGSLDDVIASTTDLISAKVIDDGSTVINTNDLKAAIFHLQGRDVNPSRTGNASDDTSANKFILNGDTDFSGTVDFTDLNTLLGNYQLSGKKWSDGEFEFNGTGQVNFNDLNALLGNYQASAFGISINENLYGTLDSAAVSLLESKGFNVVPEPTSMALIGLGGLMLAKRRRRAI